MKEKLTFKAFYPHSPERVWKALTDPEALAKWFMPVSAKPQIGLRIRFDAAKPVECTVLEMETGKRLGLTWDDDQGEAGSPSLVRWTLTPKDGGTEVLLEHESPFEAPSYVLIEARPNWAARFGALGAFLRQPVPVVYVKEGDDEQPEPKRRAGFRQEPVCV